LGNPITITQSVSPAPAQTGLRFVPLAPCRVADTRSSAGPFGGPILGANTTRNFFLPQGACGIPSNAQAFSLNVTVVPSGELGFLTVWPAGDVQPVVSTLNSDGRVKAAAAIVPVSANTTQAGISVFASAETHVVLDVDGYFVSATDGSNALEFYALSPCRVADTRGNAGTFDGPTLQAGETRALPITQSGCHVPASAQAYSLNVTVVPKEALRFLTVWPTGQTQPFVSTLNADSQVVVANAAIVPAGTSGQVSFFATDATDLVVDINGYFAPPGTGGLSLYNLTPCRLLDTRTNLGPQSGQFPVPVAGSCNVPSTAQDFVFNATVVPYGNLGYLSLWANGLGQPWVSTLNSSDGAVNSNLAIVPSGNGSVSVYASNPTQVILDIFGYFAP
jgi:hypothetical protein